MNHLLHKIQRARIQLALAIDLQIPEEIDFWQKELNELLILAKSQSENRKGFTLIELVISILVIAILVAILFPSINGIRNSAKEAATIAEIKTFEAGIATFKLKYGVEIPDELIIYEFADGWNNPPAALKTKVMESRVFIRSVWPEFDFNNYGDPPGTLASWERKVVNGKKISGPPDNCIGGNRARDIDGDGKEDGMLIFKGGEVLVFLTCGVNVTWNGNTQITNQDGSMEENVKRPILVPDRWVPYGFSQNPTMPFVRDYSNRVTFTQVDGDRLYKEDENRTIPKYKNHLGNEYCFYTSWGRGYKNKELQSVPFEEFKHLKTYQIVTKGANNNTLSN